MVLTRHVHALVRPENKVKHLCLQAEDDLVAWAESNQTVSLGRLEETGIAVVSQFTVPHRVSFMLFHRMHLVIGDEIGSISFYDHEGNLLESQEMDGGVQSCQPMGLKLAVISGMGSAHLVQFERPSQNLSEQFGLGDVLQMVVSKDSIYVAQQDGSVLAMNDSGVHWRRPARGHHGERITCMGVTRNGSLFLTREGHALVAGEEEAIEFEMWVNGTLSVRKDLRMRMLTSSPSNLGAVLGFDDGTVHQLREDGGMEEALSTGYPIFSCFEHQSSVVASSWFYIHGLSDERVWKVEHQGMPSMLCGHPTQNVVLFAGDDQNDYTEPEPIGCIDLKGEVVETDTAELTGWFQNANASVALTAEQLYSEGDDDILMHLTEDERASYEKGIPTDQPTNSLLAAMGTAESTSLSIEATLDEEELMNALNSTEELSVEETGILLDALSAAVDEVHPPRAIAGDDQRHQSEDDGTCLVLLDGRGSYDPQDQIVQWSWLDERGRELSNTPQLKLRLPVGRHAFELRVVDRQGSWTTDSLVVHVDDGSTS